jgi:hypothetical protein
MAITHDFVDDDYFAGGGRWTDDTGKASSVAGLDDQDRAG